MQNMATLYFVSWILKTVERCLITSVEEQTQLGSRPSSKEAPREVEDIPVTKPLVNMDPPTANEVKSAIDNMKS